VVHPLKNVLNRIRWNPKERADNYLITYRHRGAPGDIKQVYVSSIRTLGNSYFTISENLDGEETTIPFHRILEIRKLSENNVIWRSRKVTG
jgi:uncharacterized protein (UPF0248 family)